jgi:hypothetical protein
MATAKRTLLVSFLVFCAIFTLGAVVLLQAPRAWHDFRQITLLATLPGTLPDGGTHHESSTTSLA